MPCGIITDPDVQQAILDGHDDGDSMRELSERHGMVRETVRNIVKRGCVKRTRGGNREKSVVAGDPVEVPEYLCGGCDRMVYLDPCQICRALKGKR